MIQQIKMPSAGQTTDEARITSVKVKTGDKVKRGDILVEAETDKAVLPVESFAAGLVLDVLVTEGDDVRAGDVLVVVGSEGDQRDYVRGGIAAPALASAAPAPAGVPAGQPIKMPSAGQTTDAARITSVLVKVGDKVKRGDTLVEAETDKAVLPVESYLAGTVLEILVKEGDDVTSGDVLLTIGTGKTAARPAAAPATPAAALPSEAGVLDEEEYIPIVKGAALAPRPVAAAPAPKAKWPAMPNAKMMARELGVDLSGLTPANGVMLTRKDVRAARASEQAGPARLAACTGSEYEVLPMTKTREVIGRRMLESVQTIPAWQCTVNVNMEACMVLKRDYQEKRDVKLSYNDIMAKAIAVASCKFPLVNACCEGGEVRVYEHTNVGLAVGLDGALLVPVVKEIDTMGLEEIADKYRQVVKKARDSKLAPSDMGCGSITISNLGMFDVDQFIAIVNPPESCILAVGRIAVQPVWDGQQFRPVHMMSVTGSFDHRIIDGAYGAQFLRELKLLMENPVLMLG